MVLLIIIPMKNGYFIGNIHYFQTNPYVDYICLVIDPSVVVQSSKDGSLGSTRYLATRLMGSRQPKGATCQLCVESREQRPLSGITHGRRDHPKLSSKTCTDTRSGKIQKSAQVPHQIRTSWQLRELGSCKLSTKLGQKWSKTKKSSELITYTRGWYSNRLQTKHEFGTQMSSQFRDKADWELAKFNTQQYATEQSEFQCASLHNARLNFVCEGLIQILEAAE